MNDPLTRQLSGIARVYIGDEPDAGPHPGYRGPIVIDAMGAHIGEECEYLPVGSEHGDSWESLAACETGGILVPWHRIDQIEWTGRGWEADRAAA